MGQDIRFSENKVEIGRNFANKLWNASRFVLMNLTDSDASIKTPLPQLEKLNSVDRWILSRMSYAVDQVKTNLSAGSFKFNDALKNVYEFIWNDFCDWYIEMSKSVLFGSDLERKSEVQQVLTTCLDTALRLLHPFMPFVTEEIWQKLPGSEGFLMEQPFPEHNAKFVNVPLEEEISDLMSAVRVIRNMRVSANISPAKKLNIKVVQHQSLSNVFAIHENLIKALAGVENLETVNTKPSGHLIGLMDSTEICLDLAGIIDIQTELLRIEKEIDNTEKNMAKISGKLENESFVSRAPSEVVEKIRTDVEGYKEQLAKLQEYQKELRSL